MVVIDATTNDPVGTVAYQRIDRSNGVLEIGHVNWSMLMKRRPCATEAVFLMLSLAFMQGLGSKECTIKFKRYTVLDKNLWFEFHLPNGGW